MLCLSLPHPDMSCASCYLAVQPRVADVLDVHAVQADAAEVGVVKALRAGATSEEGGRAVAGQNAKCVPVGAAPLQHTSQLQQRRSWCWRAWSESGEAIWQLGAKKARLGPKGAGLGPKALDQRGGREARGIPHSPVSSSQIVWRPHAPEPGK